MVMVVFQITIPIVILRNTEVIKLSANSRWGWNQNNRCWNLLLHIFLNWLDSVTAASMLPSASYIKWAVFFFIFTWDIFGAGVCRIEKSSQFFVLFLNCFSTKQKCLPSWKQSSKWLHKGPQHRDSRVWCWCLSNRPATMGARWYSTLASVLFFGQGGTARELSRRLNLITNVFSFQAALEAWFHV